MKPKGIFGGHLNIRSLLPKLDQIHNILIHGHVDFLALSESWLNSNIVTGLLEIPGYNCYHKYRCSGKGGGVIMYAIKSTEMKIEWQLECLAVHTTLSPQMSFDGLAMCPSHDTYIMILKYYKRNWIFIEKYMSLIGRGMITNSSKPVPVSIPDVT